MAEIDKGLPNVRRNITLPAQEELTEVTTELQEAVPSHEKTEINETDNIFGTEVPTKRLTGVDQYIINRGI